MWEMEPHRGWSDGALAKGVNTFEGRVTYQAVAEALASTTFQWKRR